MAKTLRVRTRAGFVTKPAPDLPENRLTAEEVDDNFLAIDDDVLAIDGDIQQLGQDINDVAEKSVTKTADTEAAILPVGATSERPADPEVGMVRANTDREGATTLEFYGGDGWAVVGDGLIPIQASGGDVITDVFSDGKLYRVHAFTAVGSHNFVVDANDGEVDVLMVGGGGGGGDLAGGGGGAGGVRLELGVSVSPGTYPVVVGDGGHGQFHHNVQVALSPGEDSSFNGLVAFGGGPGESHNPGTYSIDGGSGGGGQYNRKRTGGSGVPGQGNDGGDNTSTSNMRAAGGGGGAGEPGGDGDGSGIGGKGGDGLNFAHLFGTGFGEGGWFGGGGGGGYRRDQGRAHRSAKGGKGGGGQGCGRAWLHPQENRRTDVRDIQQPGNSDANAAQSGKDNTGGGGGGGGYRGSSVSTRYLCGGNGGSGIVLVRYRVN